MLASREFAERALHLLLDFLLPSSCFGCGRPLGRWQHLGACSRCWAELRPLREPVCPRCSLPTARQTDLLGPAGGRCTACVSADFEFEAARAAVPYDDLARSFLLRIKFGGRRELLPPLGRALADLLRISGFAVDCDLVVPVPARPAARWRRGFNVAHDLSRAVSRGLGLPLAGRTLRVRLGAGATVAKRLPARARLARIDRSFAARGRLGGSRVLLVDDVLTTGATAHGCARALKAAGAREVRVAAWARTPARAGRRWSR